MTDDKNIKLETPYLNLTTIVFIAIFGLGPLFFIALFTSDRGTAITSRNWGFLILNMLLVSLGSIWLFLREPRMIIKKYHMEPLSKTNPEMVVRIAELAAQMRMIDVPIILRIPGNSKNTDSIYAFGTWRKKYIAISDNILSLTRESQDAILLHELGHIGSGDLWKSGLATSYLKCSFIYTLSQFLASITTIPIFMPKSFSIQIIWITFDEVLPIIVLFIAIRFMYQIREYAADEYIIRHIRNDSAIRKSLIEYDLKTSHNSNKSNFLNRLLYWLPEYHPGMGTRIKAINDKTILDEQIPAFFLVLGLVVGQFTSLFANIVVGRIVVSWLILVAPFCLSVILTTSYAKKLKDKVWISFKSVAILAIAVSLMFTFYVLPSVLFVDSPFGENSILLSTPVGLPPSLSQFLDFIFVILFLIPPFLVFQAWVFEILVTWIYRITGISRMTFFAWLLQLPFNLFVYKSLQEWFLGQDVLLETCTVFGLIWLMWGIGVIVTIKTVTIINRRRLDNAK